VQRSPGLVQIQSRRYLGAKTRLLDFLERIVAERCGDFRHFTDLFGGTGVVAHRFNRPDVTVFANDLLACNVVPMRCYLETRQLDREVLQQRLNQLQQLEPEHDGYFSRHFGGTFFSPSVAGHIGAIREQVSEWKHCGEIDTQTEAILLTSLLYAADRIAHTCGHYDAFRLSQEKSGTLELCLPEIDPELNLHNRVFQSDANVLIRKIETDVLYLDPPYNSRQYSDTYHLLENLIRWEKPPVFGKAAKMDRTALKSAYCGMSASAAFVDLIEHARCGHILVSYNNMAKKGDKRSNACIPDEVILEALERRGRVEVFEQSFSHFSAGLRSLDGHTERVFYCEVLG
jgi:adenine-specific DNA-methyltransferase